MRRLKIYYVIDAYEGPTGGTERQLLMLVRAFVDLGHDVRLFVLRHTPYTRRAVDFPCPISCLAIQSGLSIRAVTRLVRFRSLLRLERPDVLHAFFNDSAILVPLFCRMPPMRLLTSRRDMGYWYSPLTLFLLQLANTRVDRIICNCRAVAREVLRQEKAPKRKTLVIYNGIDINDERILSVKRPATLHAIPDSPASMTVRVCLVANLRSLKRIEDFIMAAAIVHDRLEHCEFFIVGESLDVDYELLLTSMVERMGLSGKVHFFGQAQNPFTIIRRSHIGVLTSASEGLSNSILEYMAAGLPIVCSNVGGNSELVEDGVNGYLFPAGDVDALSSFLIRLCTDSDLRSRMGAASQARVMHFSLQELVRAQLEAYDAKFDD